MPTLTLYTPSPPELDQYQTIILLSTLDSANHSRTFQSAIMKIYQSSTDYAGYSLPTVSLAYFLRYPNPYATHVLSTDTISQYIDPVTKRLHTVRLHLKKSKVPAAVVSFLPKAMKGTDGTSKTYILEKSVVDVQEGWMQTESRNMEWTGVLSVIEQQMYQDRSKIDLSSGPGTSCKTTVTLVSRLGETIKKRRKASQAANEYASDADEDQPKQGWFASWSTAGIQRTVELVGLKRTQTALVNSSEGMKVVMERLRSGGIKGVLEGMRHDRMNFMSAKMAMGVPAEHEATSTAPAWKEVWNRGNRDDSNGDDEE